MLAGLDGIQNKIEPAAPIDKDIYELPPDEMAEIAQVPTSLGAVLDELEADHEFLTVGNVFTPDLIETWIDYKRDQEIRPSSCARTRTSSSSTTTSDRRRNPEPAPDLRKRRIGGRFRCPDGPDSAGIPQEIVPCEGIRLRGQQRSGAAPVEPRKRTAEVVMAEPTTNEAAPASTQTRRPAPSPGLAKSAWRPGHHDDRCPSRHELPSAVLQPAPTESAPSPETPANWQTSWFPPALQHSGARRLIPAWLTDAEPPQCSLEAAAPA